MWNDILDVFRTVFDVPWQNEQEMWKAVAEMIGCSVERAQFLGGVLAFCAPFGENGEYLGLPTEDSCKFCGREKYARGMCLKHYRSHMSAGEFGVYQWHRICKDGRIGYHSTPELDEYGVPRCTFCRKSMLEVDPDLRTSSKRELLRYRARRGSS